MTNRYDGNGPDSPQWWPSRYGSDDEAGSLNELSGQKTLAALGLPRIGQVVELAPLVEAGMPGPAGRDFKQLILADGALAGHTASPSRWTGFEEYVEHSQHVGCHVDGLCHNGIDGRGYNGIHYDEFFARSGVRRLGAENMRPWVTRGVCLDIAAVAGEDLLPSGFVITPELAQDAADRQEVQIEPGDAVLLHTGWMSLWHDDPQRFLDGEPGAGWDLAHWLTDRRVSIVGADNWAFEVIPFEAGHHEFTVHQHLLAETGTYIIENIRTDDLVRQHASEFLFILAPFKAKGSTGAMCSPLAIL